MNEESTISKMTKVFIPQVIGGAIGAIIAITVLQVKYEFLASTVAYIRADYIPREVYETQTKSMAQDISEIKIDIKDMKLDIKAILSK